MLGLSSKSEATDGTAAASVVDTAEIINWKLNVSTAVIQSMF